MRAAGAGDAADVARLLHDFNTEFGAATPPVADLTVHVRTMIAGDEMTVLLAGPGPDGLAVLRFRPGVFSPALECYLAELYVVPGRRGHGTGRALMERAVSLARERGADHILLGTSEEDVAARALYESLGFINREGPGGPITYFYELDL